MLMIGSIPYVAQFVLGGEASDVTILMAAVLLGMMCSMPIWGKIADKTDNDRNTMFYAALYLTIVTAPLAFITNYTLLTVALFVWGTGEGGFWIMMGPILSEIIDESVVDTGQRKEGLYGGFQTFIGRAAMVIQAVSFALVHVLTGFVEGSSTQTPEAVWGIQVHFALLPTIFMLMATIIFWRFYNLTPEKVNANRGKIIEMDF